MERLELVLSGVEQALRPAPAHAAMAPGVQGERTAAEPGATATLTLEPPLWLQRVRRQLPRLVEALGAERTESDDYAFSARARRLTAERNRLLAQLRQIVPALADGCVSDGAARDHEELRRTLLRLLHDIAHHHQRVNDMVYDGTWRDVGGSE